MWYNEMGSEKNLRYIVYFNLQYSEFCRRSLVKFLGSDDMEIAKLEPMTTKELKKLIMSLLNGKASDALVMPCVN